jgi:hypothetical protein
MTYGAMTRFLNSVNAAAALLDWLPKAAGQVRCAPLLQSVPEPRPWSLLDAGLLALLIAITRKLKS